MFFLDWFFTRGVNGFFSRELFLAAPAKKYRFFPRKTPFYNRVWEDTFSGYAKKVSCRGFRHLSHCAQYNNNIKIGWI